MTTVLTPEPTREIRAESSDESSGQSSAVGITDHFARTRNYWLAAIWCLCLFPFSVNVVDPDLWGHVQYGQDWLAEGSLPRISSHNFTAIGHPWINHENLSELFLAVGFERLGILGMALVKFLAGLGLLAAAWRSASREHVTMGTFLFVASLVAYAIHPFWLFRPQMATWLGLATMVWLLNQSFRDWTFQNEPTQNEPTQRRPTQSRTLQNEPSQESQSNPAPSVRWQYLVLLAPLFILWTNAHGGFLAGLCMLGAYLFGRCIELISRQSPAAKSQAIKLAVFGLVVAASTLLNPYGLGLHRWLLHSLGEARPEIIEWHPPTILAPVFLPFFALLLVSLLAWVASERKRDWTHGLVLLVTLIQALLHIRHIALFSILALYWMPTHVMSLKQTCLGGAQNQIRAWLSERNWKYGYVPFQIACIVLLGLSLQRMITLPVLSTRYPVQAIQFMHDHDIHGRLVVSFNWAQYAIAALQPETKVSFDGRFRTCYPQHIIDQHFDLMVGNVPEVRNRASKHAFDPTAILKEGDPELVLLDRQQFPHSEKVLNQQQDEFTLLYEDPIAQLWGKRSRFPRGQYVRGNDTYPNVPWPAIPH